MDRSSIKLYYKNVMAEVKGVKNLEIENSITDAQLKGYLAELPKKIERLRSFPEIRTKEDAYRRLPYNTKMVEEVKKQVANLKDRCENLVVFGIGGSALGNIALQTALNPYMYNLDENQRAGPCLFVFDNIGPAQFDSFLNWIDDKLDRTVFNVISKSGRTAETAAQFLIVRDKLLAAYGQKYFADHIVVTTGFETNEMGEPKSTLYRIAKLANPEVPLLEVPEDVEGRFSVLSAVGLFSAAMCGIDIDSLLAGAQAMDTKIRTTKLDENPAAINAAINYHFYNYGKKISVMMPYSYALKDLADWYRQLWAESLGKAEDLKGSEVHIGPTPVKALGATDQHSQLQLYREGANDKLFTFLEVANFDKDLKIGPAPDCAPELAYLAGKNLGTLLNNEKKATEYALLESKRPCLSVIFPEVNAYTVGQFIYLFEVTTSFAGALFNINPYDQPAVELGKEAAFALMGMGGYENLTQEIQSKTEIDEKFLV